MERQYNAVFEEIQFDGAKLAHDRFWWRTVVNEG
jgi:hypothetical protein